MKTRSGLVVVSPPTMDTPCRFANALTNTGTWLDRLAIAVTTILLAPVAEELFFRGIVYPWVKRAGFPRAALWVTSAFFAAIHFNLPIFAPLLVLAIGLTLLYEHTGNLLAPIAAHSVFNALNFLKFYWGDEVEFVHGWRDMNRAKSSPQ